MHLLADSYIPNPRSAISSSGNQYVESFVYLHAVNTAKMSVIVTNNLVHFKVPAFNGLVLPTGEKVGVLLRKL